MSWIDDLKADIRRDEGLELVSYRDGFGIWTIGYGHTQSVLPGDQIDEARAEAFLTEDVNNCRMDLDRTCPWWISRPDAVCRGLVNMCFNLGINRLLGFSRMLSCLHAGDYNTAADEALKSLWAKQVGGRALRIADLYRSAVDIHVA